MYPNSGVPIAYYIDGSIHQIPSIAYIAYEAGGTICTDSGETHACIQRDHPSLQAACFENSGEIRKYFLEKGIKVIVYPGYHIRYFRDLPGVKHVQVFHGISDKAYDFKRAVLEYDLFFIPGMDAYERYGKLGLLKRGTGVLVGCTKLDRVFRGMLKRGEMLEQLGLDPRRKTVLYAPTWVKDGGYSSSWKKFRNAFLRNKPDDVNLIVKLHPNIKRYRAQEVEVFKAQIARVEGARFFDSLPDVVPLMAASDVLVGDVSSVTREFLAFKRPFVFLSNRPRWLWKRAKIALWECGRVVRCPRNVWRAVRGALEEPGRYMERIGRRYERTFYKPDGDASKRAAEILRGLIG